MDFSFTIIAEPADILTNEVNMIKGIMLYADDITVLSPTISRYIHFAGIKNPNIISSDESIIRSVQHTKLGLDIFEKAYLPSLLLNEGFSSQIFSNKNDEMVSRLNNDELDSLLKCDSINYMQFQFNDIYSLWLQEYAENLCRFLTSDRSFPVFDDGVNKTIQASNFLLSDPILSNAILDTSYTDHGLPNLEFDEKAIKHAKIAAKIMFSLPHITEFSLAEIIDIKKELKNPLIRFRSAVEQYADIVLTSPFDKHFENECSRLYIKHIEPSLLELYDLSKDASIIKNLGKQIFDDKSTYTFAASVLSGTAISNMLSLNIAALIPAYASAMLGFLGNKVSKAIQDKNEIQRSIERNSLYFLYCLRQKKAKDKKKK